MKKVATKISALLMIAVNFVTLSSSAFEAKLPAAEKSTPGKVKELPSKENIRSDSPDRPEVRLDKPSKGIRNMDGRGNICIC